MEEMKNSTILLWVLNKKKLNEKQEECLWKKKERFLEIK